MKIIKFIINILKDSIEQNKVEQKLKTLLPKAKTIKVKLPIKYIEMIEVLAIYGIKNKEQLIKIIIIQHIINTYGFNKDRAEKIIKEYNLLILNTNHNYTIDEFIKIIKN